jgi:hypothetical protein
MQVRGICTYGMYLDRQFSLDPYSNSRIVNAKSHMRWSSFLEGNQD